MPTGIFCENAKIEAESAANYRAPHIALGLFTDADCDPVNPAGVIDNGIT
jgi:hypothetical protein